MKIVTPELMGYSALATVTTLIFVPLGVRLSGRLSQKAFERILLATFVAIELKLIYDTFSAFGVILTTPKVRRCVNYIRWCY